MSPEKLILLVDDHQDDIVLLKREFSRAKVHNPIFSVHDADDALSYLSGTDPFVDRRRFPLPSLIIVNVHLPAGSGFQVISAIKKNPTVSATPIVAIGESDRGCDACKAFDLGANAFYAKRLDLRELVEMVTGLDFLDEIFRQEALKPSSAMAFSIN